MPLTVVLFSFFLFSFFFIVVVAAAQVVARLGLEPVSDPRVVAATVDEVAELPLVGADRSRALTEAVLAEAVRADLAARLVGRRRSCSGVRGQRGLWGLLLRCRGEPPPVSREWRRGFSPRAAPPSRRQPMSSYQPIVAAPQPPAAHLPQPAQGMRPAPPDHLPQCLHQGRPRRPARAGHALRRQLDQGADNAQDKASGKSIKCTLAKKVGKKATKRSPRLTFRDQHKLNRLP